MFGWYACWTTFPSNTTAPSWHLFCDCKLVFQIPLSNGLLPTERFCFCALFLNVNGFPKFLLNATVEHDHSPLEGTPGFDASTSYWRRANPAAWEVAALLGSTSPVLNFQALCNCYENRRLCNSRFNASKKTYNFLQSAWFSDSPRHPELRESLFHHVLSLPNLQIHPVSSRDMKKITDCRLLQTSTQWIKLENFQSCIESFHKVVSCYW